MGGDDVGSGPDAGELAVLINTTEEEYFPRYDTSLHEDALCYQATELRHLSILLESLRLGEGDVFVDLGCGKGRVVCFVALQCLKKVIGVELREELVNMARKRAGQMRLSAPVEIHHLDAAQFYSEEATVYYLFNPFGEDTFRAAIENIRRSVIARPRTARIVYNNSVYRNYLESADWLVFEGHIAGTNIDVWRSRAG